MAELLRMPRYGANMEEGLIGSWLVKEGESVSKGQILCVIETEKLSGELEAPRAGTLLAILEAEGNTAPCGEPIGVIGEAGEDYGTLLGGKPHNQVIETGTAASEAPAPISPKALALAEERGFDYRGIKGTGLLGIITREDVRAALAAAPQSAVPAATPASKPAVAVPASIWASTASKTPSFSLNLNVLETVRSMEAEADRLGCRSHRLSQGTHVLDLGVSVPGSWAAAKRCAEIELGGLAQCSFGDYPLGDDFSLPGLSMTVDRVDLACLASQMGGLRILGPGGDFVFSGPGRALGSGSTDPWLKRVSYRDRCSYAVLCLQSPSLPDEELATQAAEACGVSPENLYLLVHPGVGTVASVLAASRLLSEALAQLVLAGFDPALVENAWASCPVAPFALSSSVQPGEIPLAFGEDPCLRYGGTASFRVRAEDEGLRSLLPLISVGVRIFNISSGRTFSSRSPRRDLLRKFFFAD